ncbi:MAG: SET domain-containing protein-lysine N-methyltransferase [Alphaproteobacteria bacterium]|nr:SET domain-containing protein-lysine N-methyltransferase [Alphaproteobacteria bacterium]
MDQKVVRVTADQGPYGEIIRAVTSIQKGDAVFYLSGEIVGAPTKYTIQLDATRHVLTLDDLWKSMNHACTPNVRIDTAKREMVAARDIAAGEELNFNYNTTEWSMTSSFVCGCGAANCAGEIRGFKYLTGAQRESIRPYISPYISRRWAEAVANPGHDEDKIDLRKVNPEIHVFVPFEELEGGVVTSPQYDIPSFHAELPDWFKPLGLTHVWHSVTLKNYQKIVAGVVERAREREVIVLNLCDGTEIDELPGISVVCALEKTGLPFSGANDAFYVNTTSKLDIKRLLQASGVPTSKAVEIRPASVEADIATAIAAIGFPLFIKPDVSAGSSGIHAHSVCHSADDAREAYFKLKADIHVGNSPVIAEPFLDGREFTCLLVEDASQPLGLWALPPCERVFDKRLPEEERFLIYERYWALPDAQTPLPAGEPFYWYGLAPIDLREKIVDISRRAMRAVDGVGYGRVDMRYCERLGGLMVLEVNAQCGLSREDDATVGSMLKLSNNDITQLIERILVHAMSRKRQTVAA